MLHCNEYCAQVFILHSDSTFTYIKSTEKCIILIVNMELPLAIKVTILVMFNWIVYLTYT